MSKFRAETSETVARALMAYIISDCIECLNVGKTMNDVQTARACDVILDEFYFLKPDDFKLCFNRAIMGRYGATYDRIDVQVLCGWLNQYVADRMNAADDVSYNQHLEIKERAGKDAQWEHSAANSITREEYLRRRKAKRRQKFVELSRKKTFKKHSKTITTN